jgi:hypothetical protein
MINPNYTQTSSEDDAYDFDLDCMNHYIINSNRLSDISIIHEYSNIQILACILTFIDGEMIYDILSSHKTNQLLAIIRNRKLKILLDDI